MLRRLLVPVPGIRPKRSCEAAAGQLGAGPSGHQLGGAPEGEAGPAVSRRRSAAQLIKNESLEITYSYWDGTGHRRKVVVKKGDSIGDFLKACRDQASPLPLVCGAMQGCSSGRGADLADI